MRSTRKRAGMYAGALLMSLALIALAMLAGLVIETRREQHRHGVAVGPGAQGGELQVGVAGVHDLNSSGQSGVIA